MAHGLRHLRFHCTECGNCCRRFRVPLTGADLHRLIADERRTPADVVVWMSPDEVDMTGEPETFVDLPEGRRLMVLRWTDGACAFLRDNRCAVHAQRPSSCRMYPFDVRLGRRGGIRRLELLDLQDCEYTWEVPQKRERVAAWARRHRRELAAYVAVVGEFNRLQAHRRRLNKRLLDQSHFYRRALADARASASGRPGAA